MRGRVTARTLFTGFGATGSMLAAVGASFVVAGGILAFERWPSDSVDPRVSELAVASAPAGAVAGVTDTIVLPPAAPAPPAAAAGSVAPAGASPRQGPVPDGPAGPDNPPPTDPVPPPPVAVPSTGAAGGSAGTPADNQLAAVVETTTGATADVVRSVGATLPIASPLTDLAGGMVEGVGQDVGGVLRDLAGADG